MEDEILLILRILERKEPLIHSFYWKPLVKKIPTPKYLNFPKTPSLMKVISVIESVSELYCIISQTTPGADLFSNQKNQTINLFDTVRHTHLVALSHCVQINGFWDLFEWTKGNTFCSQETIAACRKALNFANGPHCATWFFINFILLVVKEARGLVHLWRESWGNMP